MPIRTARPTATAHHRSPRIPTTSRACRQSRSTGRIPVLRGTSARCEQEGPRFAAEPRCHGRLPPEAGIWRSRHPACRRTAMSGGIPMQAFAEPNGAAGRRLTGAWRACRGDHQAARERGAAAGSPPTADCSSRMDHRQQLFAGCGRTACRASPMRCRRRRSREQRRSSGGHRPRMDFGPRLLAPRRRVCFAYGLPHRMTAHRPNPVRASFFVDAIPMASTVTNHSPHRFGTSRHRCRSRLPPGTGPRRGACRRLFRRRVTTTRNRKATGRPAR